MAIEIDSELLLLEPTPVCHVPANVSINHLQLRNLVLSPDDTPSPTLYTTYHKSILQHTISRPEQPREEQSGSDDSPSPVVTVSEIAKLSFDPVCLSFARVPSSTGNHQYTLLAAGGQSAELHLSLHSANFEQRLWEHHHPIKKASINNSVLVLPPPTQPKGFTSRSIPRPLTMRVLVSNNDRTVKFYEVDIGRIGINIGSNSGSNKRGDIREMGSPTPQSPELRRTGRRRDSDTPQSPYRVSPYSSNDVFFSEPATATDIFRRYAEIKLDSAVNFTTATRDMSTLLSITDSQTIYLHNISTPRPSLLKTLSLPTLTTQPSSSASPNLTSVSDEVRELMSMHPFLVETGPHASFAAHWSADGTKFGIASQSGVVGIWDVRSDKPLWSYQTSFRLDNNGSNGGSSTTSEPASSSTTSRTQAASSMTGSFLDNYLAMNMTMDFPFEHPRGSEVNMGDSSLLSRLFDQWRVGTPAGRMKHAPPYGVRCLKFGRGAASDLVAFTEHTKRVHVLDIRRFECHQILEIPSSAPQGQLQVESSAENTAGPSSERTSSRPRPRRQSGLLVDPRGGNPERRGGRSPSPNSRQTRVNRVIENIRARLSANLAEEIGREVNIGDLDSLEQPQQQQQQQQSAPTSTTEPAVRLEDINISLTDVGDGVLHISSHSDVEEEEEEEDTTGEFPTSGVQPVVWRTVGTRATSPRMRPLTRTTTRRHPTSVIYLHRTVSQDGQGYTTGSETPTPGPPGARLSRRPHVRHASSSTTLTPGGAEETGDIAGLTWSASGESLFVATTKAIIEWRISDFGRARFEIGGGGNEWCEEGEEMAGQEMAWW